MPMASELRKVGITYENNPYLLQLDVSKSLTEIVEDICCHYQLKKPSDYALCFNAPNNQKFVTEKNRGEIQNGTIMKLTDSPARTSALLLNSLETMLGEGLLQKLKQLSELSIDDAFAGEFISIGGLAKVQSMIQSSVYSGEILAHLLKSFVELMDHGIASWDIVENKFIKNVCSCANSSKNLGLMTTQASLEILESIILNCEGKYPMIEQEVSPASLMPHLQSVDVEVQTNALAVLNALFTRGDSEKRRKMVESSQFKTIRNIIMTYIIHKGVQSPEMLHQLHVLQQQFFNLLDEKQMMAFDPNDNDYFSYIQELRQIAFDTDTDNSPMAKRQSQLRDIRKLGFQNAMNPLEDFTKKPPGILPLLNMVYFARTHSENYTRVVLENSCRGDSHDLPFARASIELTELIGQVLKIAEPPTEDGQSYHPMFFTNDHAFEEFYCVSIQLFNKTWKEMRAAVADFAKVLGVVQEQIERALDSQPTSFDQFRYKLSRLTYQEITQIWHQERRAKDQTGLQAKPILELREQIKPEIIELIKKQRLNYLIEGTRFSLKHYRRQDKFVYCRLSPNLKAFHYGDCEENTCPSIDQLTNKIAVNEIKTLLTGKDCLQAANIKDMRKKANINLAFSIVPEENGSVERTELLSFFAPNEEIFNIWIDGINILRKQPMTSEDMKKDLESLLDMEIQLRLLDTEGITIPNSPPPIPPEPPNYDYALKP